MSSRSLRTWDLMTGSLESFSSGGGRLLWSFSVFVSMVHGLDLHLWRYGGWMLD